MFPVLYIGERGMLMQRIPNHTHKANSIQRPISPKQYVVTFLMCERTLDSMNSELSRSRESASHIDSMDTVIMLFPEKHSPKDDGAGDGAPEGDSGAPASSSSAGAPMSSLLSLLALTVDL